MRSEEGAKQILQKIGVDLDEAPNGLFLPTPDKATSPLSRHRGYHSTYNEFVKSQLDRMDATKSVAELEHEVFQLQQRLKQLQMQGTPLYPNQGATIGLWERLFNQ